MKKVCVKQGIKRDEKIRVLYINGGIMDLGGISSYMMNYFRHIDRNLVEIDFVVHGYEKGVHDNELCAAGATIYHIPVKSQDYKGNCKALMEIFTEGNYQIVHSHLDAGSYHILKIAKKCGVKIRVAHSHNTDFLTNSCLGRIINKWFKKQLPTVANYKFACSSLAKEWLFGTTSDCEIVKNAIDLRKYQFSEQDRKSFRKELGIEEDDIVLGHIGRFDYQKNHLFLLKVFSELVKKSAKYKLLLIGDGFLRKQIEEMISMYQLESRVILAGYVKDAEKYYNAFDMFLLPSLFEGLGIVAIEAQANGLPCVLADTVPEEAKVGANVFKSPLIESEWVQAIQQCPIRRSDNIEALITAGYDIGIEAKKLEKRYQTMCERK